MTPALYATLSDRELTEVYFAPRDDDFRLVPQRRRRAEGGRRHGSGTGSVDRFPSAESLGITDEVWTEAIRKAEGGLQVTAEFVLMTFQWWREAGLSAEEARDRWQAYKG